MNRNLIGLVIGVHEGELAGTAAVDLHNVALAEAVGRACMSAQKICCI